MIIQVYGYFEARKDLLMNLVIVGKDVDGVHLRK